MIRLRNISQINSYYILTHLVYQAGNGMEGEVKRTVRMERYMNIVGKIPIQLSIIFGRNRPHGIYTLHISAWRAYSLNGENEREREGEQERWRKRKCLTMIIV